MAVEARSASEVRFYVASLIRKRVSRRASITLDRRQHGRKGPIHVGNKMQQLATLPLAPPNTAAAAAVTPVPLTGLPRGIHSASISPDGSRYALLADPRLPDPLAEVHTVIEAEPTSLYVIGADGTNGNWWCPGLHDANAIAWSHDGSSIAILSVTPSIGYHYVRSFIDICSAAGAKHIATIDNAAAARPVWNACPNHASLRSRAPSDPPATPALPTGCSRARRLPQMVGRPSALMAWAKRRPLT